MVVFLQIFNPFMPTIWIMLALVMFEGLLGGAAYVNTFDKLFREVEPRYKELSLSVTVISDSIGITLAAITALPVHDLLCKIL